MKLLFLAPTPTVQQSEKRQQKCLAARSFQLKERLSTRPADERKQEGQDCIPSTYLRGSVRVQHSVKWVLVGDRTEMYGITYNFDIELQLPLRDLSVI